MGVSRVVVGRVARILGGIAIAQRILLSVWTRLELALGRRSIDAHGEGGLSLLQLCARALRSDVWRGVTPKINLCLVPDTPLAGHADERRTLPMFYQRLGLEPGTVWIPPRSFGPATRCGGYLGRSRAILPGSRSAILHGSRHEEGHERCVYL